MTKRDHILAINHTHISLREDQQLGVQCGILGGNVAPEVQLQGQGWYEDFETPAARDQCAVLAGSHSKELVPGRQTYHQCDSFEV